MRNFKHLIVIGAVSAFCVGSAMADSTGEQEYLNACASCHGVAADGGGPLAELMTVEVPPLTGLSAANDGVFPMLDVIYSIDGRQGTRGHGYPMPVWGKRFKAEAEDSSAMGFGSEIEVRGRVLSIAYYLESLQN